MQVILDEVREAYQEEIVVELRSDSIEDLEANVRIGLRQFKDKMGVHAQRIVFIRDGVANNQVGARTAVDGCRGL